MSFSKRLRELRASKGMSLQDLADHMDVARQTVHEWETGKSKPRMQRIKMLAQTLEVSQGDLLEDEGPLTPETDVKFSLVDHEWDRHTLEPILAWEHPDDLPPGDFVMVPTLDVKLSAGNGHEQVEAHLSKSLQHAFRSDWIRKRGFKPNRLAAMKASGDSMEPGIFNDDLLVVDTSQTDVQDGKVYALWYEGGERVKRLFLLPGGGLRIKSDNSGHPTIELKPGDLEHIRILGRVVHRSGDGGMG